MTSRLSSTSATRPSADLLADLAAAAVDLPGWPGVDPQMGTAATERELCTVESLLGFRLPAEFRALLLSVGGCTAMFEDVDLFSPGDLVDGPRRRRGMGLLAEMPDLVLASAGLSLSDLLPVAVSATGLDLHCLVVRGPRAGEVVWTIGYESTVFPGVADWLAGLLADAEGLLVALRELG